MNLIGLSNRKFILDQTLKNSFWMYPIDGGAQIHVEVIDLSDSNGGDGEGYDKVYIASQYQEERDVFYKLKIYYKKKYGSKPDVELLDEILYEAFYGKYKKVFRIYEPIFKEYSEVQLNYSVGKFGGLTIPNPDEAQVYCINGSDCYHYYSVLAYSIVTNEIFLHEVCRGPEEVFNDLKTILTKVGFNKKGSRLVRSTIVDVDTDYIDMVQKSVDMVYCMVLKKTNNVHLMEEILKYLRSPKIPPSEDPQLPYI